MAMAKPALTLVLRTTSRLVPRLRYDDTADTELLRTFDAPRRVVAAVCRHKMWWFSENADVLLDRRHKRWDVTFSVDDLDVGHHTAFRLLDFDELSKLGWPMRFSAPEDLRRRLEQADELGQK